MPSSEGGGFDSITRSANELLSKINRIDFDAIGVSVAGITKGLDSKINGPEIKSILADTQDTMRKLDAGVGPAMARAARHRQPASGGAHPGQPAGRLDQRRLRRRIRASTATSRPWCASSPTRCARCARCPTS